ncbi:hypothetical protein JL720_9566 [Aureococcus anophagefferens]|nr:hypothetical protein JL720_9566 [Aureococcus anophagefferens]
MNALAPPTFSPPPLPTAPPLPDGSLEGLVSRLVAEASAALANAGAAPYGEVVAASAAATLAVSLPLLALNGRREKRKRLLSTSTLPEPSTFAFNVKLLLDWARGWPAASEPLRAAECLALCEELGPTFIKLGQALSIRTDLVNEAYALELRKLQDAVPPFADAQAMELLRRELGVYRGDLRPGAYGVADEGAEAGGAVTSVAVKVQRPGVLAEIALDLHILRLLTPLQVRASNFVNKVPTEQEDIDTAIALVDEWGRGFVNEVDYVAEARNTEAFSAAMRSRGLGAVVSPRVVGELLRPNVLVTEWIDGTRLDASASPDVPRLCGVAINAYLTMLLDTGTLHCDPHPGNLLRTLDGKLCILDWGMTLEVPGDLQYALLEFIAHINTENLDAVPRDFVNLGFTPPDKLDAVARSGVTDGLAFMLRQLSGGGGAKKIQERVKAELVERYGTEDQEELRTAARAEMMARMEEQLASEGVDVRGVSNVMEEMSRRNRELFQLPTWVLYECYPYLARRLFTDDSPRARVALTAMLYGPNAADMDGLDLDKFSEMVDGFSSYTSATSGAGVEKRPEVPGLTLVSSEAAEADAQRELANVLLAEDGNLVQDVLIAESAKLLDAAARSALTSALDATPLLPAKLSPKAGESSEDALRGAIQAIRGLPGPARAALLPLTGGVEARRRSPRPSRPSSRRTPPTKRRSTPCRTSRASSPAPATTRTPPTTRTARGVDAVAKLAPGGDVLGLATPENANRAGLIGRRFAAAVLDRAAKRSAKLADHGEAAEHAEAQVTTAAARALASAAESAAETLRPNSPNP